jgi:DNA-binding transcriptional regulator YiaG
MSSNLGYPGILGLAARIWLTAIDRRFTGQYNVHIMNVHDMNILTPRQIKALRKKLGLSQSALARKLGVVRSAVNNWERGKQKPLLMAVKFMEVLLWLQERGIEYEEKETTSRR